MRSNETDPSSNMDLDEDDRTRIETVFERDVVPKLRRHHARTGALNCRFAGECYDHWLVFFRSSRDGFEITGFEYDKEAGTWIWTSDFPGIPHNRRRGAPPSCSIKAYTDVNFSNGLPAPFAGSWWKGRGS